MSNRHIRNAKKEVDVIIRGGRSSVGGVKPDVLEHELKRIYKRDSELKASVLVNESRPDDAPLHPAFEWDDSKAAEEFRLTQARNLIRVVQIVTTNEKGEEMEPTSGWVHVPSPPGESEGSYHPVEVVVTRPDYFAMAMQELTTKVRAAQNAVESLERAAASANETDADRLAKIAIAVQAMQTASAAVHALH